MSTTSNSPVKLLLGLVVWFAAVFAALQTASAPVHQDHEHSVCGVWGCGPALHVILAWQAAWLIGLVPAAVILGARLSARASFFCGAILLVLGVVGLAAVGVHEAITWLPLIQPGEETYFLQRCLFVVGTMFEVPFVTTIAAGLVMIGIGWRKKMAGRDACVNCDT